jgi:hypothetical protein
MSNEKAPVAADHGGDDQDWVKLLKEVFVGDGLMECLTIDRAVNDANGTGKMNGRVSK